MTLIWLYKRSIPLCNIFVNTKYIETLTDSHYNWNYWYKHIYHLFCLFQVVCLKKYIHYQSKTKIPDLALVLVTVIRRHQVGFGEIWLAVPKECKQNVPGTYVRTTNRGMFRILSNIQHHSLSAAALLLHHYCIIITLRTARGSLHISTVPIPGLSATLLSHVCKQFSYRY